MRAASMANRTVVLAMDVEPVLISTSAGAVGAVVTLPGGCEQGAVAILPGSRATRAGLNQVWALLASSLAAVGVCSIRLDYPGTAESHLCRTDRWEEGTAEAIDWFRQRTTGRCLVLMAECGGLLPAYREVMKDPAGVSGVGVVLPSVGMVGLAQLYHRARTVAGRAKRLAERVRYGPPDVLEREGWPREILRTLQHSNEMLVEISSRVPLWVLSSASDPSTAELLELNETLARGVSYELELAAPTLAGHCAFPGEREIVACATAWVSRHLGLADPSGPPASATAGAVRSDDRRPTQGEPQ
jgi:hypothetical protein